MSLLAAYQLRGKLKTEGPSEWDMILPRPPRWGQAEQRCGEIPGQAQKNDIRRKQQKICKFFKKQFRFTPVISPICGESYFTVKTADFRRVPFAETLDGLRIVCGVSIRKSVNSAGLERGFFRQKQAFYKCDPK